MKTMGAAIVVGIAVLAFCGNGSAAGAAVPEDGVWRGMDDPPMGGLRISFKVTDGGKRIQELRVSFPRATIRIREKAVRNAVPIVGGKFSATSDDGTSIGGSFSGKAKAAGEVTVTYATVQPDGGGVAHTTTRLTVKWTAEHAARAASSRQVEKAKALPATVVPPRRVTVTDAIQPGVKVEVIDGPALLKRGTEVLAQVPTGTVLEVKKVKGKWVGVRFVRDGKKIFGWVYSTRLRPAPSQPRPPEQEAAIRQPEQAPKPPRERKDASGPKLVRPGDRARVVVATAELKLDGRTVGTLEKGREVVAVDVRGDLVKVEAWSDDPEDDEVPLRGWVEAKQLAPL